MSVGGAVTVGIFPTGVAQFSELPSLFSNVLNYGSQAVWINCLVSAVVNVFFRVVPVFRCIILFVNG